MMILLMKISNNHKISKLLIIRKIGKVVIKRTYFLQRKIEKKNINIRHLENR